jgi:hypothetical protein
MGLRRTYTWLAIAPLGLGLTTGLTITTTLLTQQPIGLSSEPLSAGDALAPRVTTAAAGEIRAHAAPSASAPTPHGGRAVATGVSGTQAAATPPAITPSPPTPPQAAATTHEPTPAKQPAHTPTPTQAPTPTEGHRGRDGQRSSDGGGSDSGGDENSGSGVRDD